MTADERAALAMRLAREADFAAAAAFSTDDIELHESVRAYCAEDLCDQYGKRWACPPYCGTLEECGARIRNYALGVVAVTEAAIAHPGDIDGMRAAEERHHARLFIWREAAAAAFPDFLMLGAGACKLCERCTCPDAPCRHPDRMLVSMEASGMIVRDLLVRCGLPYHTGGDRLTFAGCLLLPASKYSFGGPAAS